MELTKHPSKLESQCQIKESCYIAPGADYGSVSPRVTTADHRKITHSSLSPHLGLRAGEIV
jgi:hypothetical protein